MPYLRPSPRGGREGAKGKERRTMTKLAEYFCGLLLGLAAVLTMLVLGGIRGIFELPRYLRMKRM